ncbi:MAG: phytoene/squalene synthase family protein [Deltaproteobacteria bacterium]|nr:MAG: phytoene/squalene synthase family protein [Deltaproteobacteria bacterium]
MVRKTLPPRSNVLSSPSDEALLFQLLRKEGVLEPDQWKRYFAHHSRSFSFAAMLFPREQRMQIASVYAYSRFTDDLVDSHCELSVDQRRRLLALWQSMSSHAYKGGRTGIFLLDKVMGDMAHSGASFSHANELIEGVRMDLETLRYPDMRTLCLYAYRVASTIGLWLTELFGTHDRWMLARAAALGEAMQLTNILRDVGEDLERDRIYLPQDRMEAHGVNEALLRDIQQGAPIPENYKALIEELLCDAEQRYNEAFVAIPGLPSFFQKPVVVAAYVYRGIHHSLRQNGYDNFRFRARTSLLQKLYLAWGALSHLRQEQKSFGLSHRPERQTLSVFEQVGIPS